MKRSNVIAVQYEDKVRIATPEGVELELALAGIGSRLAARLIDHLIQAALTIAALLILAAGIEGEDASDAVAAIAGVLAGFAVFWAYDVLFEAFAAGRTPGKRALGLRVVGERGEPVSFSMAAVRNVLRLIDEYLTLWLGALVSMVRSRRRQRLGDMAAGTLVVREAPRAAGDQAGVSLDALDQLEIAAAWDTTRVSDEELAAARRFLERRYQLDAPVRRRLAQQLDARLRHKVHGAQTAPGSEQFVELLVAVRSRRG